MNKSTFSSSGGTRGAAETSRTVLVVDDEHSARSTIAAILESEGYRTRCAASGEEGMSLLAESSYDVVCTDYKMGNATGLDVLRFAESLPQPVCGVLVTGFREYFGTTARTQRETSAASVAMLVKPVDPDELLDCVRRAAQFTELRRLSRKSPPPERPA